MFMSAVTGLFALLLAVSSWGFYRRSLAIEERRRWAMERWDADSAKWYTKCQALESERDHYAEDNAALLGKVQTLTDDVESLTRAHASLERALLHAREELHVETKRVADLSGEVARVAEECLKRNQKLADQRAETVNEYNELHVKHAQLTKDHDRCLDDLSYYRERLEAIEDILTGHDEDEEADDEDNDDDEEADD